MTHEPQVLHHRGGPGLLTDLAAPAGEASQAGAGEGRVPRDAVVDALASVQTRPEVWTHRGCREAVSFSLSLSKVVK